MEINPLEDNRIPVIPIETIIRTPEKSPEGAEIDPATKIDTPYTIWKKLTQK